MGWSTSTSFVDQLSFFVQCFATGRRKRNAYRCDSGNTNLLRTTYTSLLQSLVHAGWQINPWVREQVGRVDEIRRDRDSGYKRNGRHPDPSDRGKCSRRNYSF